MIVRRHLQGDSVVGVEAGVSAQSLDAVDHLASLAFGDQLAGQFRRQLHGAALVFRRGGFGGRVGVDFDQQVAGLEFDAFDLDRLARLGGLGDV